MKPKFLLLLLLLPVLVIAGYIILSSDTDPQSPVEEVTDNTADVTSNSVAPSSGVGSLEELQARNGALECSITYRTAEDSLIEGSYFTRNGMVRADFVQENTELGTVVTSYVSKDGQLFVWSEIAGELYGVRYETETTEQTNVPVPDTENVRYNCSEWLRVDDSIFETPSDVLFTDGAAATFEYGTVYETEEGEF